MPGCPILRPEKHKSASSIRGAMRHHLRTIPTKNADPERRHLNVVMIGPPTPSLVARKAIERAEPLVKRVDANRAVELFLGASDEFWENGGDHVALGEAYRAFLEAEFGAENIIGMGLHLDENKPHWWVIVTPIHNGKLTSAHWFDGPHKLAKMHDRIAEFVKPLGMERAQKGVKQTHIEMQTLHQAKAGNESAIKLVGREMRRRLKSAKAQAEGIITAAKTRADEILKEAQERLQKALEREEANEVRGRELRRFADSLKVRETNVQELAAALTPVEEERAARELDRIQREKKEAAIQETRSRSGLTTPRPPSSPSSSNPKSTHKVLLK